ncbi:hypothetical protein RRG08_011681 [Elysia crispata]|uniref:Uncharacterized protein n=1 Tax=Elysia crispata TaxID=231223 RepID=A0AAE0ZRU8_9GAST|nr:hypothetical protein RRG08_011681 [Elysia crispata]
MPGLKAKRSPAPPPPPRWSTSPARPRNHLYARIGSPAGRKQRRRERIATPFSRENGPRVRLRRSSDLSDVVLYAFPGERGRSRTRGGTPTPLLVWRPRGQGQPRKRTSSLPGDSKSDPWWLSRTSVRPTPRSRSFSRSNMPVVALAAARRRGRGQWVSGDDSDRTASRHGKGVTPLSLVEACAWSGIGRARGVSLKHLSTQRYVCVYETRKPSGPDLSVHVSVTEPYNPGFLCGSPSLNLGDME